MKQLISVTRPSYGQDASFGITPVATSSYTTVYSNIPASIQPASTSIQMLYAERQLVVSHQIFVDTAITVKNGDIVSDGTNEYKVTGFENLISLGLVYRIDCNLILTAS